MCGAGSFAGAPCCTGCGMKFGVDAFAVPSVPLAPEGAGQEPCLFVSLREFLADGSFGGIRLGMDKNQILARAGYPALSGSCCGTVSLMDPHSSWINGKTTFWFSAGRLERIGVYYLLDYPFNNAIAYDAQFPERGADKAWLQSFMQEHDIGFGPEPDAFRSSCENIVTAGGVQVIVSDGNVSSLAYPAVLGRHGRKRRVSDPVPLIR